MKLVYGDQVVENASVVIQPTRLCQHDKPGRIKQLIELTVPADVLNGGYAVRQLLGQDPDIGAKSVVTLEVALTQQQIEKLKTITEDELRDIRNGVNPAMIYGVRVYDSEPMDVEEFITGKKWPKWFTPSKTLKDATGSEIICFRRDSENSGHTFCVGGKHYSWHEWKGDGLQLEEITEPEAQAIIAHSVKPTGEYLGCVQWFQHQNPSVIVRRDSHDRCTYFEHDSEPVSGLAWHESFTAWVKSGDWKEITQQEAERRIGQNRMPEEPKAQEPQPGICKREQFAGGGAPSPRNCDVCQEGPCPRVIPVQAEQLNSLESHVGVDWAAGQDFTATVAVTTEPELRIVELTMQSVLTPGVWVVAFDHKSHMLLEIKQERTLEAPVPASKISGPIGVKLPVQFRSPVMPSDYGRKVYFRDEEFELEGLRTGFLKGFSEEEMVYMVSVDGERTRYLKCRHIWIIDQPTEGF